MKKRDVAKKQYVRKRWELFARRMNREARLKMMDVDITWYVAFTPPGNEYATQRILREQGAFAYFLLDWKWRRVNRYTRNKTRFAYPAIAGMLFIGVPKGEEDWYGLFGLSVLTAVLSVAGRPKELPGADLVVFVDQNARRLRVPSAQRWMRTHKEFEVGDRVRIAEGPFKDHLVDVSKIAAGHAHIVLSILGQTQDVEIPLDQLERVG